MAYLPLLLIGLGIGFFAANVRVFVQFLRCARLRRSALLIWPGRRPPFYPLLSASARSSVSSSCTSCSS
jgi:hypothetical protein